MREPFRHFRIIFNILLILEIKLGIAIITVAVAYQNVLGSFTPDEKRSLNSTFVNLYIMGFQLIATYLCSLSMWRTIWTKKYSRSIQLLLVVWSMFCFIIIIGGCATIWCLLDIPDILTTNVSMMLFHGIEVYYTSPAWKFLWDELQYNNECCGVNGYDDWMRAKWMPKSFNRQRRDRRSYVRNRFQHNTEEPRIIADCVPKRPHGPQDTTQISLSYETPRLSLEVTEDYGAHDMGSQILAPYACCKHNSLSCYQNYIPKSDNDDDEVGSIFQLNFTEINTKACLPLFKEYLWYATHILLILVSAAVIIDIIICCLAKYLMFQSRFHSYCELEPSYDEDGNALVIVKCPPKVRCVTLDESISMDSDVANVGSDTEPCICCCDIETGHQCSNVGQYLNTQYGSGNILPH
ncbi:tetraspanin 33B [Musca autumnalis]|uniref:tetraspanin 33B n=1 Tax=Musca autumnalis TaxID=221902 RepID=UPI003CEB75B5